MKLKHYWLPTLCAAVVLILNVYYIRQFNIRFQEQLAQEQRKNLIELKRLVVKVSPGSESATNLLSNLDKMYEDAPRILNESIHMYDWEQPYLESLFTTRFYLTIISTVAGVWLTVAGLLWMVRRWITSWRVVWYGLALAACLVIVNIQLLRWAPVGTTPILYFLIFAMMAGSLCAFFVARTSTSRSVLAGCLAILLAAVYFFLYYYGTSLDWYWELRLEVSFGLGASSLVVGTPYDQSVFWIAAFLVAWSLLTGSAGGSLALLEKKLRGRTC